MSQEKHPDKTEKIKALICLLIGIAFVLIILASAGVITNSIVTIIHVWKGEIEAYNLKMPLLYMFILVGFAVAAFHLFKYSGKILFKDDDGIR
jgi:TRAP-type C4-dicarboxylate transport system permease small subunit